MSEVERIVVQLERAYRGDAWHGPSIREVLDGVDAEQATARPLPGAHTIREIAVHVIAWEMEVRARLRGEGKDELPPEEDWPDGAAAWNDLLQELDAAHEKLVGTIRSLNDEDLAKTVAGHPSTAYELAHGVIQHNLYHAGQMALLKKAL